MIFGFSNGGGGGGGGGGCDEESTFFLQPDNKPIKQMAIRKAGLNFTELL